VTRRRGKVEPGFDAFVAGTAEALLKTAYLLVWDMAEAEDLVQECLLGVARRWPRVAAMEHPHAYARRILVNLVLDGAQGRARRRHELAIRAADHHEPPAAAGPSALDADPGLLDALRALPKQQRATVVLRYFEDLSEAQTAQVLGCSVGTVKSTTSRALDRLRHTLGRTDDVQRADSAAEHRPITERSTTP
jgi:RNA polymerase sigma-70 factor (sigma-E family)